MQTLLARLFAQNIVLLVRDASKVNRLQVAVHTPQVEGDAMQAAGQVAGNGVLTSFGHRCVCSGVVVLLSSV